MDATYTAQAQRYVGDAITTASPARLVTLLYDRLVEDLHRAEAAIGARDHATSNEHIQHAQDVVLELALSLRTEAWSGAASLASIYSFLLGELTSANVAKDLDRVSSCRGLVEPLRDAWHEAALAAAAVPSGPVERTA